MEKKKTNEPREREKHEQEQREESTSTLLGNSSLSSVSLSLRSPSSLSPLGNARWGNEGRRKTGKEKEQREEKRTKREKKSLPLVSLSLSPELFPRLGQTEELKEFVFWEFCQTQNAGQSSANPSSLLVIFTDFPVFFWRKSPPFFFPPRGGSERKRADPRRGGRRKTTQDQTNLRAFALQSEGTRRRRRRRGRQPRNAQSELSGLQNITPTDRCGDDTTTPTRSMMFEKSSASLFLDFLLLLFKLQFADAPPETEGERKKTWRKSDRKKRTEEEEEEGEGEEGREHESRGRKFFRFPFGSSRRSSLDGTASFGRRQSV